MTTEYMARTVVNLPFIDERFEPGQMISVDAFERYADAAATNVDDRSDRDENASALHTADSIIKELLEWGSITDDPSEGVHPDHVIPDPSRPSLASVIAQAEQVVAMLEEAGEEVPAKLRALTEISDRQVSSVEKAIAAESSGAGEEE